MTYNALLHRLYQVNLHGGVKLNLENIQRLCLIFNNPQNQYRTVHVAGTNGKGSVSTKIAKGFELSKKKTGLYTSPHISCFRERIQINGTAIPEKEVAMLLTVIFEVLDKEKIPATFFEISTLLAFLYFKHEQVEIAVLETGLGGRLDATNVVHPEISIITSISLDHTQILGDSIEKITKEKAGIIKSYVPVLIGPNVPFEIVFSIAEKLHSPCLQVTGDYLDFDLENQAIAKKAMEMVAIPNSLIEAALKIRPPCRREMLEKKNRIILDVAHNPDGLKKFFHWVEKHYPKSFLRVICGLSKEKDSQVCVKIMSSYAKCIYVTEATNGRGIPREELYSLFQKEGMLEENLWSFSTIQENVKAALNHSQNDSEIIVVCGTFFIMSEARAALGIQEPKDPLDLNERFSKNLFA